MVAAAHSESHEGPPGNAGRIFERGWGRRTAVRLMETRVGNPNQSDPPSATAVGADAGPPPARPAIGVTTDFGAELAPSVGSGEAHPDADGTIADPVEAKPAKEVTTDFGVAPAAPTPMPPPSASACALHRDARGESRIRRA